MASASTSKDMKMNAQDNSETPAGVDALKSIQEFLIRVKKKIKCTVQCHPSIVVEFIPEMKDFDLQQSEVEDYIDILASKAPMAYRPHAKPFHRELMKLLLHYSLSFERWVTVHEECEEIEGVPFEKECLKPVRLLSKLEKSTFLMTTRVKGEKELYQVFKKYLNGKKMLMKDILRKRWRTMALCKKNDENRSMLSLIHDSNRALKLLIGLDEMHMFPRCLYDFRDELMKWIINPILDKVILIKEKKSSTHDIMTFVVRDATKCRKNKSEIRLENIEKLLNFLSDSFFNINIRGGSLMKWIGDKHTMTFSNEIAHRCIYPAIVENALGERSKVADLSKKFYLLLAKFELVKYNAKDDSSILIHPFYNFDKASIALCYYYLRQGVKCLKEGELHQVYLSTEEIEIFALNKPRLLPESYQGEYSSSVSFKCNVQKMEDFPISKISVSTQRFMFAIESIFKHKIRIGPIFHKYYLEALHKMFLFYKHKNEFLCKNLPRNSAIIYNNYMVICHFLSLLKTTTGNDSDLNSIIDEFGPKYKLLGMDTFKRIIKLQIFNFNEMIGYMNCCHKRLPKTNDLNKAEGIIKTCFIHLDHLRQEWYTYLPDSIYFESMEKLIDHVLEGTIRIITGVESVQMPSAIMVSPAIGSLMEKIMDLCKVKKLEEARL